MPRLLSIGLILSGPFCLSSCFLQDTPPEAGGFEGLPVSVAQPYLETVALTDIYTGRFEAVEEVDIRARVSGYLESVHFQEGNEVKKGDLMFQIDPRTFDAIEASAKARLQQAQAAQQLAKVSLDRATNLVKDNAISQQEFDIRQSEAAQADADVLAAQAELRSAQLDREFAAIEAPISGIAGEFLVTPGNFISGGNASATLLTTIVPHDPVYCYFEADERQVLEFTRMYFEGKTGGRGSELKVQIALSDMDEFEFEGTINFADNKLDDSTATMRLRARVENKDSFITPGLFAKVKVPLGDPQEVLLVRDTALGFDQSKRYAWVVNEDNTVHRQYLETGRLEGQMRIVREGLTVDDRIVVSGSQLLQEGTPVAPTPVEMNPEKEAPEAAQTPAEPEPTTKPEASDKQEEAAQ